MEFVKVTFPSRRSVQMDGAPEGHTGDLLGVQRGHHIFNLGEPVDYTPPNRTELVAGTSQDQPMIIKFEPDHLVALPMKKARSTGRAVRTGQARTGGAGRVSSVGKKTAPKKTGRKKR